MFHIFCGCPFLTLLFLLVLVCALFAEHNKLKRHSVATSLYWRVMLFAAWLLLAPMFAILCFAGIGRPQGITLVTEIKVLLIPLALLHNGSLRPFFNKYEQAALDQSFRSIWVR